MPDGYSVHLEEFKQALEDHVDKAVDHFSEGADRLRPLQSLDPGALLGADPAGLNGAFAMRCFGVQSLISQAHDQLRDSLKALSDALWEAYRVYSTTEQQHTERLRSIRRD
ncbi:MAG TPA: hypothetical protein VG674_00540 [Amycolatopsis sp.]|nr:hypothetical protein [Amycolatopsis sp.]